MPEQQADILILEPDETAAAVIAAALPVRASRLFLHSIAEAEEFLDENRPRLFLCADDLPGESGLMFLARTEQRWPGMRRVLMAPDLDGELFFHAMREVRIFSYLNKPLDRGELVRTVHHAFQERRGDNEPPQDGTGDRAADIAPWLRLVLVWVSVLLGSTVVVFLLLSGFGLLYEVKSLAGIDIFANWHLADLFRR